MDKSFYNSREDLFQMSTQQLDDHLAQELRKDFVNEETVKHILAILREREKNQAIEITPQIQQAWEVYQNSSSAITASKPKHFPRSLFRVASVAILLFALIPSNVNAETFWDRFTKWTSEIFEFFSPVTHEAIQHPHVFKSEHPGLQQVYADTTQLGITLPVIPMRIPDEYTLTECKIVEEIECVSVHARLSTYKNEMLLEIKRYNSILPGQYEKDQSDVKIYEIAGINHYIMRNIDRWNVVWTRDNLECFLSIDCQETELYEIIKSIYISEGNQ